MGFCPLNWKVNCSCVNPLNAGAQPWGWRNNLAFHYRALWFSARKIQFLFFRLAIFQDCREMITTMAKNEDSCKSRVGKQFGICFVCWNCFFFICYVLFGFSLENFCMSNRIELCAIFATGLLGKFHPLLCTCTCFT